MTVASYIGWRQGEYLSGEEWVMRREKLFDVVAFGLAEKVAEPPDLTKQIHMVIGRFTDCPWGIAFDAQNRARCHNRCHDAVMESPALC
jgi:hypothetical protein